MDWQALGQRIQAFAVDLTKVKSVVSTGGERQATQAVMERLGAIEYFIQRPDQLYYVELPDDPLGRNSVVAVIKGEQANSQKTVVLIGHTDTVGTSDYGTIEAYATDPDQLPDMYHQLALPPDALADLTSGKYLFGRGIFDMKSGVSILVHLVEEFAQQAAGLAGNIVFCAVSDEEGNSGGMLRVVPELIRLRQAHGFDYQAMIDTDYSAPRYEGDDTRYIYLGTVGKLMPSFYCVGSEAHGGDPFRGIDPNHISSAIVSEINFNMAYAETAEGEVTVPPISLRQQDLKPEYSVQTARTSYVYFNFSTHTSTPDQLLPKVKAGALRAFQSVIDQLTDNYQRYAELSRFDYQPLPWQARVLSYEELIERVTAERGPELEHRLAQYRAKLLQDVTIDERAFALHMVAFVHSLWSDQNPVVIVYWSPPYYPHIYVKDETAKEKGLIRAVEQARLETDSRFAIEVRKFYPYISDLSYGAAPREPGAIESLQRNMPGYGVSYWLPLEEMRQLDLPVVNIGPFGKGAHQFTERVEIDYSYYVVPQLVYRTIENLLK